LHLLGFVSRLWSDGDLELTEQGGIRIFPRDHRRDVYLLETDVVWLFGIEAQQFHRFAMATQPIAIGSTIEASHRLVPLKLGTFAAPTIQRLGDLQAQAVRRAKETALAAVAKPLFEVA
jgi:hypothetical protein